MSRTLTATLALVAFAALLLVQFLPWSNERASGFGNTADTTAYTWGEQQSGSYMYGFGSGSSTKGWYDGGWDSGSQNAVNQIHTAVPVLTVAAVLLLVGSLLAFTTSGPGGAIVTTIGALGAAAGTWLFAMALNDLYNGNQVWQASFYLAIIATVLALAGGVVGLATGNTSRNLA